MNMESRTLVISLIDYLLDRYDSPTNKNGLEIEKKEVDLDFFNQELPTPYQNKSTMKQQKNPEIDGLTNEFEDFDFDTL